jgi:hypothetical protein
MFNPLSKMSVSDLGLDADLLEAAMKCGCKKESAYNPSCAMDDLKAEPNGSKGDAMPSTSMNIAYESKKKKMKKEGVFGDQEPGGPAMYHKEETDKSFDAKKDARMSINQLKSVLHNTTELLAMVKPDDLLPEWVETKITLAEDYMVTCSNFLRSDRTK